MSLVIHLAEIKKRVKNIDVTTAMEEGFIQYSNGNTVVPPVGELIFDKPPGDVHIKYGYIKKDDYYVIKIASGFYENPSLGIASCQGLMLLFNQKTGELVSVLLDEGYLTDIRTAAAGALVAKYFAPQEIKSVGIIGTGMQARLQLLHLQKNNPCKTVWLWGRNRENAEKFKAELNKDFNINIASTAGEVARNANLIVTTTPSDKPLLNKEDILPGTLITAMGSDTPVKQELNGEILQMADIVISDSIPQSKSRGEVFRAVKSGHLKPEKVVELGNAIQNADLQRKNNSQIIVADLTGVAVQDIMIASAVFLNS